MDMSLKNISIWIWSAKSVVKQQRGEHLMTRPGAKLFDDPFDVNLDFHVKQP